MKRKVIAFSFIFLFLFSFTANALPKLGGHDGNCTEGYWSVHWVNSWPTPVPIPIYISGSCDNKK